LHTACAGQDLSNFDFSFDCVVNTSSTQTHSMGVGSFDTDEEYDTDLKCQQCLPPGSKKAAAAPVVMKKVVAAAAVPAKAALSSKPVPKPAVLKPSRVASSKPAVVKQVAHKKPEAPAVVAASATATMSKATLEKRRDELEEKRHIIGEKKYQKETAKLDKIESVHKMPPPPPAENADDAADDFVGPEPAPGMSFVAVRREATAAAPEKAAPAPKNAEWYGPDECVGVWRDDDTGTCFMQTDCDKDTQLSIYEFGLVCIDDYDAMTRHIFGTGSFGRKENFNTHIKCKQCKALDEYIDGDKAVDQLTEAVESMQKDLKQVSSSVAKLNAQVFSKAAGPAPAAPAPAAAKPTKFLSVEKAAQQPSLLPSALAGKREEQERQQQPSQPAVQQPAAQEPVSDLGKDVSQITDNGSQVNHVKKKASQVFAQHAAAKSDLQAWSKQPAAMKQAALQMTQGGSSDDDDDEGDRADDAYGDEDD